LYVGSDFGVEALVVIAHHTSRLLLVCLGSLCKEMKQTSTQTQMHIRSLCKGTKQTLT